MKSTRIFLVRLYFLILFNFSFIKANNASRRFPDTFLFGAATAAYQIEGAWNVSDKGETIWDRIIHEKPHVVDDGTNADEACDSYNLYKRDVEMLAELGVDYYRFSISWARLLPTGLAYKISEDGKRYYNDLINELLAKNITPVATLYHWDLPQRMQDLGGWPNPLMADYFEQYAQVAYILFGDRVKTWLTFNEPQVVCFQGYGTVRSAPLLNFSGVAEYLCAHTLLRAHAKAYHLYDTMFRKEQNGRVGLTLNSHFYHPASDSEEDIKAAKTFQEFELGWFANPIFSDKGDYPEIMRTKIDSRSKDQGFAYSRLPKFSPEDLESIRGSADYFGLNHYTTYLVKHSDEKQKDPSYMDDAGVILYQDPKWPAGLSKWLKVVPWGFRKLLNLIKDNYGNPEIIVFENGYSDANEINDTARVDYYKEYLNNLLDAMEDGCNVTAFSVWSLMDNFEWLRGFRERFGLYYVHYDTPDKIREPKASARYFSKVIKTRTIN